MAKLDFGTFDVEGAGLRADRLGVIRDGINAEIAAGRIPGAVLAVARRGRVAFLEAFGQREPESGTPMAPDAIFSIASMTKPMTSVAILQLVEQGRILLGDPVSAYLPEMAELKVGKLDGHTISLRAPSRLPTIQDLLRHTSGFTYQNRGSTALHATYPGSSTTAALTLSKQQAISRLASCPLMFEPGSSWEYGFSTDVLGFVVEAVSGQTLGDYLSDNIWEPLGMTDTAFRLGERHHGRYARALPNDPVTGAPQSLFHEASGTPHWDSGGGGAVSTARDYLRFAEMLRHGGSLEGARVLGPQTVRLMTADHLPATTANRIADTMDPAAEGYGFGLGVAVRRADGVSALVGSQGDYYWSGVFGTYFWIDPDRELSCVFLAAAPGTIRLRMRQVSRSLVYQALAD